MQLTSKLVTEDNTRVNIVGLTEKFLIKNTLTMEDKMDMSFPTIKFNPVSVAKLAEMEKQACEIIMDNILEELKRVISDNTKLLTLDLGLFGAIKIKNRNITHEPCEKNKSSNVGVSKKMTIKSLMQK